MRHRTAPLALLTASVFVASSALCDEGMWPFDMVPVERIEQEHHVKLTPEWLDHVRLASVRFNVGGSGSFISPRGLVLTNHHVASDCIAKLSRPDHDYLATGYTAGKDGPEVKCPDLELDQLQSMQDVTARVAGARAPGMSDADANRAIKATMSDIEKECHDKTGLRCDVITLYAGAKYELYQYRRFTDVRLAFAPEADIAFFGGDPDNFNYPRFDLDLAIFRVYDGDQPFASRDFLSWSPTGPKNGDTVFTSGNPGGTDRNQTLAQLAVLRDVIYPRYMARLHAWRDGEMSWAAQGAEQKRQARETLFGINNSLKAVGGFEAGLRDASLMRAKGQQESKLRAAVDASADLKAKYASAWPDIERVQKALAAMYPRYEALENGLGGSLLRDARALVRLPAERALPNDQRLPEYRETRLDELKMHVLSFAPVYPGVEVPRVREWLSLLQQALGPKDPLVVQILGGRTPERAAREMVSGSKLYDVYARRALWEGGRAAVDASKDPVIAALRAVDAQARAVRKQFEDGVEAPMRDLGRKVAEASFAVNGTSIAPDANFTLRLSVGTAAGYTEGGKTYPWTTDFGGLYKHATGVDPDKLPARWVEDKTKLDASTPLDFVSTNDIIGGNSGSPVVDAEGKLVGLIFDSNLPALPNRFSYQSTTARAISVDTASMLQALRVVYGADALADEIAPR